MNMERQHKLQAELKRFLPILINQFKALKIIVFGSLAGQEVLEWSDLDIVVVRDTPLRFFDRIAELIQVLRPQVGVDLLVYTPDEWNRLIKENLFIRQEIYEKGKELYAA